MIVTMVVFPVGDGNVVNLILPLFYIGDDGRIPRRGWKRLYGIDVSSPEASVTMVVFPVGDGNCFPIMTTSLRIWVTMVVFPVGDGNATACSQFPATR